MKRANDHARVRAVQRYTAVGLTAALEEKIADGEFEYLRRQTKRRTLCRAVAVAGEPEVWFILDRENKRIVTVLTKEQASHLM